MCNNAIIIGERIYLRPISLNDLEIMYEMDSDPDVNIFLGNNPVTDLNEMKGIIELIIQQYKMNNGVGRLAVIEKETENFLGWSGLKYHIVKLNDKINIYELGYRFLKKYWGKGFATEAAFLSLDYGFKQLQLDEIYACADIRHDSSNKVLSKIGMEIIDTFDYDKMPHYFYVINK